MGSLYLQENLKRNTNLLISKNKITGLIKSEDYLDHLVLNVSFFCSPRTTVKEKEGFNIHPTVKPQKLIEHLYKIVTPKYGKVIDPFMGSGTTGVIAVKNKSFFVGVEMNREYFDIALKRVGNAEVSEESKEEINSG